MITFSVFADEIAGDLKTQISVCLSHGIRCIDVRAIDGKNVSKMTPAEAREYKKQMDETGITVPCIGSPLGKIKIGGDFRSHMDLLKNCCEVANAFGTNLIRVFSFYPTEGKKIEDQRRQVMDQLAAMVDAARSAGIVLMHENEKKVYGRKPQGVLDIFATIKSPNLKSIFDPANYVEEGVAPYDQGWKAGLDKITDYFHIKDINPGEKTCVPAGQGKGQMPQIFRELKERNWSGYMTLEPHLKAAGQFQGFTGPDLFARAVEALKNVCDQAGLMYQ